MPWKTTTPMEEAIRFAVLAQSGRFTVRELCEQFGISRKTGYKHLERYAEGGAKATPHVGTEEAARGAGDQAWHRNAARVQHDSGASPAAWAQRATSEKAGSL
jgi:transposase